MNTLTGLLPQRLTDYSNKTLVVFLPVTTSLTLKWDIFNTPNNLMQVVGESMVMKIINEPTIMKII